MKIYSLTPPPATFNTPDKNKHYLVKLPGNSPGSGNGIVFNLNYGENKYKVLSASKGHIWMSYEADSLEELFEKVTGFGAEVFEFDTMKELLEYALSN